MEDLKELEVEQNKFNEKREKIIDKLFDNFLKRCEGKTIRESREVLKEDFSESGPFEFEGKIYRQMQIRLINYIEDQMVIRKEE